MITGDRVGRKAGTTFESIRCRSGSARFGRRSGDVPAAAPGSRSRRALVDRPGMDRQRSPRSRRAWRIGIARRQKLHGSAPPGADGTPVRAVPVRPGLRPECDRSHPPNRSAQVHGPDPVRVVQNQVAHGGRPQNHPLGPVARRFSCGQSLFDPPERQHENQQQRGKPEADPLHPDHSLRRQVPAADQIRPTGRP